MKKFRIGIIGTENSHAVEFSGFFNKPNENSEFAYPNCRVTMVYGHYPEENEKLVKEYGVAVAKNIEEMVKNVDAVMITTRDGKFHAEFARPFIEAGIPAFIDKPFTTDVEEAETLIALAKEKNVPLCGGSSLKYAEDIQDLKQIRIELGDKLRSGSMTAPLSFVNDYSGFWFYSSHLAEMCMETFGWNPKSVTAVEKNQCVYATVNYDKFSVNCSFINGCYNAYDGAIYGQGKAERRAIGLDNIFRLECDAFVDMLHTGKMSHSYEELLMPVKFIAAVKQAYETGKGIEIK